MPEERYFVAVDGRQLDGEHDMSQVRQVCTQYAGRQVMVWNEALGSWTDPKTLPSFRVGATPAATPAHVPAPEPARAPEPAAAPKPSPYASAPRGAAPTSAAAVAASDAGAAMGHVMSEDASALKGLLDLKLETFVAPKLIRVVYVVLVILCALAALGGILSGLTTMAGGLRFSSFGVVLSGLVMIVIGPVVAVFYLALMRIVLEGVQVLFQIREKLEKR